MREREETVIQYGKYLYIPPYQHVFFQIIITWPLRCRRKREEEELTKESQSSTDSVHLKNTHLSPRSPNSQLSL